ncbi:TetR family transcriptional regulator C-terminal domain-containing protein [Saccharospirillum salsuginis]|uniref:TetR family transcriptional regulator n=1 Tax=Saccharospirillum salsuginis TaxID=418750 RepID=A0A918K3S7_9GAMM|nr:TetR family transcriptional regulator C-terminal domain-containing protein [Saccharospirillum salsuginis]GGX45766.1 TetR family transcriptional regulator [Saccharospirillum salsuginis]
MSKREKNRAEVQARILDAAEEAFSLNGFGGTSFQDIARAAGVPKANVVYYYSTKEALYREVLGRITRTWNDVFEHATEEDDPAEVLDRFIRHKLQQSVSNPRRSRIFAMEILQGAPHHGDYLRQELRPWVRQRADVIRAWIEAGKMRSVDPLQLIFMIWATTQHYADFEAQVLTLLNRKEYEPEDIQRIGDEVSALILRGCGLEPPESRAAPKPKTRTV